MQQQPNGDLNCISILEGVIDLLLCHLCCAIECTRRVMSVRIIGRYGDAYSKGVGEIFETVSCDKHVLAASAVFSYLVCGQIYYLTDIVR